MGGDRIVFGARARAILAASLARTARAVGSSLGPAGRALIRDRGANSVEALHSGAAIARVVAEESGPWSIAPRILGSVLSDIEREFQDGTARATCICEAIYASGVKAAAHGVPPGSLADALLDLLPRLDELIERESFAAPSNRILAETACHDAELAETLSSLGAAINDAGIVDIKESRTPGVSARSTAGFALDVQPHAIGLGASEQVPITLDRASILVVNDMIEGFGGFASVLEQFVDKRRSLVVVARGFGDEARATLLANRNGLGLHLLGLVPEDVGLRAAAVLEDLAVVSGATLIDERLGFTMSELRPSMLGQAKRLHWWSTRAVLTEAAGIADVVEQRRRSLLLLAEREQYLALDREHLLRRAARLAGTWAELHVGPQPSYSPEHRTSQAKAALSALRQAAIAGVVPGGGVALARVGAALESSSRRARQPDAIRFATQAAIAGCRSVIDRIAINAGHDGGAAVALASRPAKRAAAFDAARRCSVPLRDWTIADPLSTTRSIMRKAVSAAATMLRVETLICT
jgi:chaperonin GroEL